MEKEEHYNTLAQKTAASTADASRSNCTGWGSLTLNVVSWNIGGVKDGDPFSRSSLKKLLEVPDDPRQLPDIYIINFQEFCDLSQPLNYLPQFVQKKLNRKVSRKSDKRESRIINRLCDLLVDYTFVLTKGLVGLRTFMFATKKLLDSQRLQSAYTKTLKLGFGGVANKGAIIVTLFIDNRKIAITNLHLNSGDGCSRFESRMRQIDTLVSSIKEFSEDESPGRSSLKKRGGHKELFDVADAAFQWDKDDDEALSFGDLLILSGDFNFRGLNIQERGHDKSDDRINSILKHQNSKRCRYQICSCCPDEAGWITDPNSSPRNPLNTSNSSNSRSPRNPLSHRSNLSNNTIPSHSLAHWWSLDEFRQSRINKLTQFSVNQFYEANEFLSCFPTLEENLHKSPPFAVPTYKYIPNSTTLDDKRCPAWTDRTLIGSIIGTPGERTNRAELGVQCLHYDIVQKCNSSDHLAVITKLLIQTYS